MFNRWPRVATTSLRRMKQQIILKSFSSSGFDVVLRRTRALGLACCDLVFLPARPGPPPAERQRGRFCWRAPGGEVVQIPVSKARGRGPERAPGRPSKALARPYGNRMAAHR